MEFQFYLTKTHVQMARPWDVDLSSKRFPSLEIVPFELYPHHKHPLEIIRF